MARYGNPGRSNAGARREASFRESRRTAERALLADVATNAVTATNVVAVPTEVAKVVLADVDLLALVTDTDKIQPITAANVLDYVVSWLDAHYVLTPKP